MYVKEDDEGTNYLLNIINKLIEQILNNKNTNISKSDELLLKFGINGDRLSLREKYRVEFQDNSIPNLINDTESRNID